MNEIDQLNAERSLLEAVAQGEHANQRQLSRAIGLSLGKTHYLVKELVDRGLIKVGNFSRSQNKLGYVYLLTPSGVWEKTIITKRFIKAKEKEYELFGREIDALRDEIVSSASGSESKSW